MAEPETPLKHPWLWTLFCVVLLSIPVASWLLARHHHHALTKYGHVPAFALTDQNNQPIGLADLDGKVWVADFIFTSCSEACPRLTERMAGLQRYLVNRGEDGRTRLVSISVDPERDTPARLRAFAKGYQADPRVWHFLTGPYKEIQDAVVHGFKQAMEKDPDKTAADGFTIVHGTKMVLIDASGEIRGFYDSTEPLQMEKLRLDLSQLLAAGGT